jgi:GNAT superfamily N-acetyltransferase
MEGPIMNVFTERSYRRRGLARALLQRVLEWAGANGLTSLVLHASAEGRALYEQAGFVPTNEMRYSGDLR